MDSQIAFPSLSFPTIDTRRASLDAGNSLPAFTVPSHGQDHIDPLLLSAGIPITPMTPALAASSRSAVIPSPETPAASNPLLQQAQSAETLMATLMFQTPQKLQQQQQQLQFHEMTSSTTTTVSPANNTESPEPAIESFGTPTFNNQFDFTNTLFTGASMDMFSRAASRAVSPTTSFTDLMNVNAGLDAYNETLNTLNAAAAVFQRRNSMALQSDFFSSPGSPSTGSARRTRCQSDVSGMRRPSVVSSAMSSPFLGHMDMQLQQNMPPFYLTSATAPTTPGMAHFSSPSTGSPSTGFNMPMHQQQQQQQVSSTPSSPQHRSSLMNMIRRNSMIGTSGTLQAATTGGAPVKKQRFKPQEKDLQILMGFFEKNPFPDRAQRTHLANTLGLEPKQILFWFQNRRATLKMNGIVCMKPKSQNAQYVPGEDGMSNLTPLMPDSTFFYVEQKTQVQQQQQE